MGYSEDDRLRGVAGWLGFLCLTFLFLSPTITSVVTWTELHDAELADPRLAELAIWRTFKLYTWSLFAVATGLSVFTGWRLYTVHRPSSVRLTMAMLWALGPGLMLLDSAIAGLALGIPLEIDSATKFDIIGGTVGATLWTAYLLLSRRVKNTYYADDGEAEGAGTAPG